MLTVRKVAILVLLSVLAAAGCGEHGAPAPQQASALSGMALDGDFTGSGPGTLKSASTLPTIDRRIRAVSWTAARVTYESTSGIDGTPTLVSGTVFSPKGKPPPGGWPIVAFGHGSTGVMAECAPSLSPELLGASTIVALLLKAGYVVTVSDFQGLGLDQTYHPYLDSTTGGFNLIDSVRAARKLVPDTSDRWAAFGGSQGGGAAWAANELAATYGAGLSLVTSVSLVPAADITGLADAAAAGVLTADQGPMLQWVLVALKNEHLGLNLDDYRRGIVQEKWDVMSACRGAEARERAEVIEQITPDDLRPATPGAADLLRGYLRKMSLPKVGAAAPMLVVYGGRDQLVSQPWTDRALDEACALGDNVTFLLQPDKGHDDIDGAMAFGWIKERFDGVPVENGCVLRETGSDQLGG